MFETLAVEELDPSVIRTLLASPHFLVMNKDKHCQWETFFLENTQHRWVYRALIWTELMGTAYSRSSSSCTTLYGLQRRLVYVVYNVVQEALFSHLSMKHSRKNPVLLCVFEKKSHRDLLLFILPFFTFACTLCTTFTGGTRWCINSGENRLSIELTLGIIS